MAPVLMAPIGRAADMAKSEPDGENQWTTILGEVQTSAGNKLPSCKKLVVLGDNESGKTTLIAKLQGTEDSKKGAGLEYYYVDVRDEYREDHTRLGVYVLDGEPTHSNLLKFALSEKSMQHTTALLCVAMSQPWTIVESLKTWATVLEEHIHRLKIPPEQFKEFQDKMVRRWQLYMEPGDELDMMSSSMKRHSVISGVTMVSGGVAGSGGAVVGAGAGDASQVALPLSEDILVNNIGLDLVVVVTKTDFMSNLEKEHDYKDEHFDYIQQTIRKFCLQYGAALFYTSVKEDKNCDLLYKYLVHRIYAFPFHTPALVVEKDAVFIPSGWDNEKKIGILYENMKSVKPDDVYSDVIMDPVVRKPLLRDLDVEAEDEQVFLTKQQALLNQQAPPQGPARTPGQTRPTESPIRAPAGVQKTPDRRISGSPGVQPAVGSPKKIDGAKGAAGTSEGVLANFFNSLLTKRTGTSPGQQSQKTQDKASPRSEAVAELDRMTGSKKSSPGSTPSHNSSPPPS